MNIILEHLDGNKIIQKQICPKKFQIMAFIFNALEDGWSIKKKDNSYIFKKNHEGKKEILEENFLNTFIDKKLNLESFILC